MRKSLLTARFSASNFCLNSLYFLSLLREKKNLWFVHYISSVLANSKTCACFSLDPFSKAWEIETTPHVRRVVRESGWRVLSLRVRFARMAPLRGMFACGGCSWHPNFLKKWKGFNSMTAFIKENGCLSNFLPTYLIWSCLSSHVCLFLYTSCSPIHLWRKYLWRLSVLC